MPTMKTVFYGATNLVLFLAGVANLGVGTLAAFNEAATVATTSLTAGLVLLSGWRRKQCSIDSTTHYCNMRLTSNISSE